MYAQKKFEVLFSQNVYPSLRTEYVSDFAIRRYNRYQSKAMEPRKMIPCVLLDA